MKLITQITSRQMNVVGDLTEMLYANIHHETAVFWHIHVQQVSAL